MSKPRRVIWFSLINNQYQEVKVGKNEHGRYGFVEKIEYDRHRDRDIFIGTGFDDKPWYALYPVPVLEAGPGMEDVYS